MTTTVFPARSTLPVIAVDASKLLFSFSSFLAAAMTLTIAFAASLPRPWWALLTVYVTAQPMAGAFRPKILYRLAGILTGATVTLLVVPNLQNSPELLVLCLAAWTGFCIYLAVLDRTPRAYLFQMAAFSTAVISFPYLDDPGNIFATTVARVQEMGLAILCVSVVHALLQPWSATPVIRGRAESFLADAVGWGAEALGSRHTRLEHEYRRKLAADVTELGMIAIHLPFDQRWAPATRQRVVALQHKLANLIPLTSAAANRLDLLRGLGDLEPRLAALVDDIVAWLAPGDMLPPAGQALVIRCNALADLADSAGDWSSLLTVSACERMAAFLEELQDCQQLLGQIGKPPGSTALEPSPAADFRLARDHGVAALAGLATATAIALYCAFWILLAWPNGSATAAFAALITLSFATQDDPAPVIGRYLWATLKTFPIAALYLFVILPRVEGLEMLILTLAPALLWMGYIQADPRRAPEALPMFSCFIVGLGFQSRFQADFALFINTGLAQLGGIIATLAVTKMFRSANIMWTARRIARAKWADLAILANIRQPFRPQHWTAQSIDRLGQTAARMAVAPPGDALHAADGLVDLRIGRNVISIRSGLATVPHTVRRRLGLVLLRISALYMARSRSGQAEEPSPALLRTIDEAMVALLATRPDRRHRPLLALVGMRCNLFPAAAAPMLPAG